MVLKFTIGLVFHFDSAHLLVAFSRWVSLLIWAPSPTIGGLMWEGHPISGQTKRRAMWVSTKKGGVRKATPSVTCGTP